MRSSRQADGGRAASPPRSVPLGAARLLLFAGILLLGFAACIPLLSAYRLHADEALFASLARLIVTGRDPLLNDTTLLVDKPPLFYLTLAAGVSLGWANEAAARIPGLLATVISVALAARLALHLYRSTAAAALAALLMALSPYAISFGATAFADPLMIMWALAALVVVTSGGDRPSRWGWAGLLLGAAFATKQSGILFLPLAVALGAIADAGHGTRRRDVVGWLGRFAAGLGIVLVLVVVWDLLRGSGTSFWVAGVAANNPHRLARSSEVWARAAGWLAWLRYFGGGAAVSGLLLGLAVLCAPLELARRRPSRRAAASLALIAFAVAYLALQWLVAFPLLDRYLLPLVFVTAILAGRGIELIGRWLSARWKYPRGAVLAGLGIALLALVAGPAIVASRGGIPVGGDRGAYDGIREVESLLRELPEGSVVYYDTLGWPLTYYLFDARLYLSPFSSPADLNEDLTVFHDSGDRRVLVLPGWESHAEALDAARQAGYGVDVLLQTVDRRGEPSIIVYELSPG